MALISGAAAGAGSSRMRSTVRKFCVATTAIMMMPPIHTPTRRQANRRKCMPSEILPLFQLRGCDLDFVMSRAGGIVERGDGSRLRGGDRGVDVYAQLLDAR